MEDLHKALATLSDIDGFHYKFAGITKNGDREFLPHAFWSSAEIEKSLKLKNDWEVPAPLIPFYGDWHDLFCLDSRDGCILELDDSRETTFSWGSFEEFKSSLILEIDWKDEPCSGNQGVVSSEFNF